MKYDLDLSINTVYDWYNDYFITVTIFFYIKIPILGSYVYIFYTCFKVSL